MELSKIVRYIISLCIFFSYLPSLYASSWKESGQILYLVHQGKLNQAIDIYNENLKTKNEHDYELLHRIGLAILDNGFNQKDPEVNLMTLFGASISAHDEAYYILEESLQSPHPQLQLVALGALAKAHNDMADKALIRAMNAGHPLIRLEAAYQLCLKKHPQAVAQTESLMYKLPKELKPLFPQLFACSGDEQASRILKRLLNDPSEEVRIAAIESVAKHKRDDFLPQIRQLAAQQSFHQQEVAAKAIGELHDDSSIQKLQKMTTSQYPFVRLAAWDALDKLGDEKARENIEKAALDENIYAISLLAGKRGSDEVLLKLMNNSNIQVRVNAVLSLLENQNPNSIKGLAEILIHDKKDLGFSTVSSPGGTMDIWKATPSSSEIYSEDDEAYSLSLHLKEMVLEKARRLPSQYFLQIADGLFATHQTELIPKLISLLVEIKNEDAIAILKKYQQKPGAPLVRQYCNMALFEIGEEGPYSQNTRDWVKNQKQTDLIQFRPPLPWNERSFDTPYVLTPEQKSRLLIESLELISKHQDKEGLAILLDAIQNGNTKNRYALAGLLVRATQ